MRVSYHWLLDYVDIPWDEAQLAERLTMAGFMVEAMAPLSAPIDDVVVAEIVALEAHPGADQLTVATVADGIRTYGVVSGAPNLAVGDKVPLARPGARLPGGVEVKKTTLRGVDSEGMLCSEAELGVGDDGSGVWVLPADAVLGRNVVAELGLDDTVFHLEVYPNRPDSLSVLGIAREVAAMTGQRVRLPEAVLAESRRAAGDVASIRVEDVHLCPRYSARIIENVTVGPSPKWLQQRLRAAGMRSINNVVDVTNFVMWEWGQPLHAFDLDRVADGHIVVRRARADETVVTLDGHHRRLQDDMLLIADVDKPIAIAGVMGAANSEVDGDTTRLLLEAAAFHPVSVRRTAQRLGLRSEASHRFEKGLDPNLVSAASTRAAALLQQLTGGTLLAGLVDEYPQPVSPWRVGCRPARVRSLLGLDVGDDAIAGYLEALELGVDRDGEEWAVTVPTFRTDLRQEADLIEEVARLHGYDRLPSRLPGGSDTVAHQSPPLPALDAAREALAGAGLLETMSYSFISPDGPDKLGWGREDPRRQAIPLRNPLKEDMAVMRTSLLPGLLETAARNRSRRNTAVHIFEIGSVFLAKRLPLTSLPDEARRIGMLLMGPLPERHWGRKPSAPTFYHVKGLTERLGRSLGAELTFAAGREPALHPGRRADVFHQGRAIGFLGEVHPDVAANYGLAGERIYVAELDADALADVYRAWVPAYRRLPKYPALQRDVALIVPQSVTGAAIEAVLWERGQPLLESIELFDVYEGPPLEPGVRSLAYSLTLRAPDRTLTDEDADGLLQRIDEALSKRFGVRRRV